MIKRLQEKGENMMGVPHAKERIRLRRNEKKIKEISVKSIVHPSIGRNEKKREKETSFFLAPIFLKERILFSFFFFDICRTEVPDHVERKHKGYESEDEREIAEKMEDIVDAFQLRDFI